MKKYLFVLSLFLISYSLTSCDRDDKTVDYDFVSVDKEIISGIWYHTYEIDSLVLVFEEQMMKEYIFDKNSKKILSRTDYGKYYLYKKVYHNGKIENRLSMSKSDSLYSYSSYYDIKDNILSIFRGSNLIKLKKVE